MLLEKCVFAFLLAVPGRILNSKRLVMVTNGNEQSYSVYENPWYRRFPDPKNQFITTVKNNGRSKNTLLTYYCSEELTPDQIVREVVLGLPRIWYSSELGFRKNIASYKKCWEFIKDTLDKPGPDAKPIQQIVLEYLESQKRCTAEQVASLASEGYVRVGGENSCIAPFLNNNAPLIETNDKFQLDRNLWRGEAYLGKKKTGKKTMALAWFQGHLHLFRIDENGSSWHLLTSVGQEAYNGKFIHDFIKSEYTHVLDQNPPKESKPAASTTDVSPPPRKSWWFGRRRSGQMELPPYNLIPSLPMERVGGTLICDVKQANMPDKVEPKKTILKMPFSDRGNKKQVTPLP
ncbi:BgtE-5618 [Blumeria graminis f. sp. tritici]|uniref:BgtE-5618 n=3 Tax=Blumeria graminis f. sp. tritici TaxID=62690 RepID=A0A9X9L7Q5_BLUGR|nr:putative secreted effector protein [Blumeria graminis f. sp. tritici 96224]VCU39275.1 BgtE-5618 [Blumeria graminis f. sp. tritici]